MTRRLAWLGAGAVVLALSVWWALALSRGDERWGVIGFALDPPATAEACQETAGGELGYALTADAPPDPELANIYATLSSRADAERVAACLRSNGADNVEVSEAGPTGTFSPN